MYSPNSLHGTITFGHMIKPATAGPKLRALWGRYNVIYVVPYLQLIILVIRISLLPLDLNFELNGDYKIIFMYSHISLLDTISYFT